MGDWRTLTIVLQLAYVPVGIVAWLWVMGMFSRGKTYTPSMRVTMYLVEKALAHGNSVSPWSVFRVSCFGLMMASWVMLNFLAWPLAVAGNGVALLLRRGKG